MRQRFSVPTSLFSASRISRLAIVFLIAAFLSAVAPTGATLAQSEPGATESPTGGNVPGRSLGNTSDSEFWRAVRQGSPGMVSIPDQQAAFVRHLDSPGRVVIEVEPDQRMGFDSEAMFAGSDAGASRTQL